MDVDTGPWTAETTEKSEVGGIILPDMKANSVATVIHAVWDRWREKRMREWSQHGNRPAHTCLADF